MKPWNNLMIKPSFHSIAGIQIKLISAQRERKLITILNLLQAVKGKKNLKFYFFFSVKDILIQNVI